MGNLSKLFQYKTKVVIKDPRNDTEMAVAWVRLLGDQDLREAYRQARIASAETRAALRDADSIKYKDAIAQLDDVPRDSLVAVITASRESQFESEASDTVVREDLPKIEEISTRPDAPSLEEQERLDTMTAELDEKYQKALQDYIETRKKELIVELDNLSPEDLVKRAKDELANIQALETFINELNDWRGYLGTYDDPDFKNRSFESVDEFRNSASELKAQIIQAYTSLEMNTSEIKN